VSQIAKPAISLFLNTSVKLILIIFGMHCQEETSRKQL